MKNDKGFTLIELIMVIAIIGIVTALIAPNFSQSLAKRSAEADRMAIFSLNDTTEAYALVRGESLDYHEADFVFSDCEAYDPVLGVNTLNADLMMNRLMENGFLLAPPSIEASGAEFKWSIAGKEWIYVPAS